MFYVSLFIFIKNSATLEVFQKFGSRPFRSTIVKTIESKFDTFAEIFDAVWTACKRGLKKHSTLSQINILFFLYLPKKNQSIRMAIDSKVLNKSIHKIKCQLPNIETLIDS